MWIPACGDLCQTPIFPLPPQSGGRGPLPPQGQAPAEGGLEERLRRCLGYRSGVPDPPLSLRDISPRRAGGERERTFANVSAGGDDGNEHQSLFGSLLAGNWIRRGRRVRWLSPAASASEGHTQLFPVVEEVLFGAALAAYAVGDLLIRAFDLPVMGAALWFGLGLCLCSCRAPAAPRLALCHRLHLSSHMLVAASATTVSSVGAHGRTVQRNSIFVTHSTDHLNVY